MRNIITVIIWITALTADFTFAQEFPDPMNPPRLVNDFVGVLSDGEFRALENKLLQYEDTTSNQIAIVIISSTGGYDIGQYSAELGEKWGVGRQGKDNGILILTAIDDRNIFISTGYGLEGAVTDAASNRIIDMYIVPNFRNEDYYTGFEDATSVIIGLAAGEFQAEDLGGTRTEGEVTIGSLISFLFPVILIFIFSLARYRRMARRHYGHDAGFWAILALMMSSSGRRGGSNWDNFSGGTGSFGGGGGFGGFGGGGFGGGGAGGSW